MVRRAVKWSEKSIADKFSIYNYWIKRNQSILFAEKLDLLFDEAISLACIFPFAGIRTDIKDVRYCLVRSYKLIYRIRDEAIEVLAVWDGRQNPEKLKNL